MNMMDEAMLITLFLMIELDDALDKHGKSELEVLVVSCLLLTSGETAVHAHYCLYYVKYNSYG